MKRRHESTPDNLQRAAKHSKEESALERMEKVDSYLESLDDLPSDVPLDLNLIKTHVRPGEFEIDDLADEHNITEMEHVARAEGEKMANDNEYRNIWDSVFIEKIRKRREFRKAQLEAAPKDKPLRVENAWNPRTTDVRLACTEREFRDLSCCSMVTSLMLNDDLLRQQVYEQTQHFESFVRSRVIGSNATGPMSGFVIKNEYCYMTFDVRDGETLVSAMPEYRVVFELKKKEQEGWIYVRGFVIPRHVNVKL